MTSVTAMKFPVAPKSLELAKRAGSLIFTVKTKTLVLGNAIPVLGVKLKRGWIVF